MSPIIRLSLLSVFLIFSSNPTLAQPSDGNGIPDFLPPDTDGDGTVDDFDPDDDNDGILDEDDNAQFFFNPGQEDENNDGIGDVMDPVVNANGDYVITLGDSLNLIGSYSIPQAAGLGEHGPNGFQWTIDNLFDTGVHNSSLFISPTLDPFDVQNFLGVGVFTAQFTVFTNRGVSGSDTALITVLDNPLLAGLPGPGGLALLGLGLFGVGLIRGRSSKRQS